MHKARGGELKGDPKVGHVSGGRAMGPLLLVVQSRSFRINESSGALERSIFA